MGGRRALVRLLLTLLLAALPPAFAVAALLNTYPVAARIGLGGVLLAIVVGTAMWVALLAIPASRLLGADVRRLLDLTERGQPSGEVSPTESAVVGDALRRAAAALQERNRQIAELAARARSAGISAGPAAVTAHVVETARQVTRDPTWVLVVLTVPSGDALPPGVYSGDPADPAPLDDVHAWASVSDTETPVGHARRIDGPWGAFLIVDAGDAEGLRALLMAPHEGRPLPSPAELDLLTLIGEHSATVLEHAILYHRVQSQAERLDRLADIQRDFLRGVTHDLQTPLTSIGAIAAELRSTVADARVVADLSTIADQADRLRRMVGQLLAVGRLEAGALAPRQEVFRIEPLVRKVWEALRVPDRPFEVSGGGPAHLVVADPDRVEQVLWAVLDNAVKYSTAGSPISARIEARVEEGRPGELACAITIRDEGIGMDRRTAAQAFDQFYRADAARSFAPNGSGIGLHAARGLVEAMSGSISLASSLGGGTAVTVTLPAEPSDEAEAEAAAR